MRSLSLLHAGRLWPALAVFLMLAVSPLCASTITLASTFGSGLSFDTVLSDNWFVVGGGNPQWIAASFQPSVAATLDSVDLGVNIFGTFISVDLDTNAGGVPGSILESFALTGNSRFPVLRTGTSTLHPLLTAGTTYWLVLTPGDSVGGWYFNNQGLNGADYTHDNGTTWATDTQLTPAFDINGTTTGVPEPSSALLFLTGLGGIGLYRRRRA